MTDTDSWKIDENIEQAHDPWRPNCNFPWRGNKERLLTRKDAILGMQHITTTQHEMQQLALHTGEPIKQGDPCYSPE